MSYQWARNTTRSERRWALLAQHLCNTYPEQYMGPERLVICNNWREGWEQSCGIAMVDRGLAANAFPDAAKWRGQFICPRCGNRYDLREARNA